MGTQERINRIESRGKKDWNIINVSNGALERLVISLKHQKLSTNKLR